MITYTTTANGDIAVKLDRKLAGAIKREPYEGGVGWRYFPKGWPVGGQLWTSLDACKRSLEAQ